MEVTVKLLTTYIVKARGLNQRKHQMFPVSLSPMEWHTAQEADAGIASLLRDPKLKSPALFWTLGPGEVLHISAHKICC